MSINNNHVCCSCSTTLKKQTFGLNVIYYCPQCGIITTANQYDYNVSKYGYNTAKAVAMSASWIHTRAYLGNNGQGKTFWNYNIIMSYKAVRSSK
jgi:predicted RNA-binding Zn-ribbon protein involved in translation (DUF1610 family)